MDSDKISVVDFLKAHNIHIGDVVRLTIDNTKEEYIAVSRPVIPVNNGELNYNDAYIFVIPKDLLDTSKNYREQLKEIYRDRMGNIENKRSTIMRQCYTANLIDIQKIDTVI